MIIGHAPYLKSLLKSQKQQSMIFINHVIYRILSSNVALYMHVILLSNCCKAFDMVNHDIEIPHVTSTLHAIHHTDYTSEDPLTC